MTPKPILHSNGTMSIIIALAQNRKKDLLRCLTSIYASQFTSFEVIIVNNSVDFTIQNLILAQFPTVRFIEMPHNTGMLAYNIGVVNSKGTYILVIDDDCSLEPTTLTTLVEAFEQKSKSIAALVCHVYVPSQNAWTTQSLLDTGARDLETFAGATAFRRSVIEKVGFYDHEFFCWYHEPDLAFRIRNHGYRIQFLSSAIVYHHTKPNPFRPGFLYLLYRNLVWLHVKHFSIHILLLLIFRDLVSIAYAPIRYKSLRVLIPIARGYLSGWINCGRVLSRRNPIATHLQMKYLQRYCLGR